jgi:hypothetical protein
MLALMSLFSAAPNQGTAFLQHLARVLDASELERLRGEGGFGPPNDFPIERLAEVLAEREFPNANWYEFLWAIHEVAFERLASFSPALKAYLAALYLYCNKRQLWGLSVESDYYFLVLTALRDEPDPDLSERFLTFVEWLEDAVPAATGYDDYYALLAWTLLRRLRGETQHASFQPVLDRLLAKNYGREELEALCDSERSIDAWWNELHEKIPCPEALRLTFALIMGQ